MFLIIDQSGSQSTWYTCLVAPLARRSDVARKTYFSAVSTLKSFLNMSVLLSDRIEDVDACPDEGDNRQDRLHAIQ